MIEKLGIIYALRDYDDKVGKTIKSLHLDLMSMDLGQKWYSLIVYNNQMSKEDGVNLEKCLTEIQKLGGNFSYLKTSMGKTSLIQYRKK